MLDIGFRAYDFGRFASVDEFASCISGYKKNAFVHLPLNKTITTALAWEEWNEEYIAGIRDVLDSYGISVKVVGCTINPVDPDEDRRKYGIARFKRNLELARAFGSNIVGTESGAWSTDISYSMETFEPYVFDILLSSLDEMVNTAIKNDVTIAIEPVAINSICTQERIRKVLDKFDDRHLSITFDPVNLIPRHGIAESDGTYRRVASDEAQRKFYLPMLREFKDRISIVHAKDYIMLDNGLKKSDLTVLTGAFDWKDFILDIKKEGIEAPMILENLNPSTLKETLDALNMMYGN